MNYSGFERIESQIVSVIYDAIFVTRHACPPVKSLHFSLDHDWGVNVTSYWGTSIKLSNNIWQWVKTLVPSEPQNSW